MNGGSTGSGRREDDRRLPPREVRPANTSIRPTSTGKPRGSSTSRPITCFGCWTSTSSSGRASWRSQPRRDRGRVAGRGDAWCTGPVRSRQQHHPRGVRNLGEQAVSEREIQVTTSNRVRYSTATVMSSSLGSVTWWNPTAPPTKVPSARKTTPDAVIQGCEQTPLDV